MRQGIVGSSLFGVLAICLAFAGSGCLGPGSGDGYRSDVNEGPGDALDQDDTQGGDTGLDDTGERPDVSTGQDAGSPPLVPDPYMPQPSMRFELAQRDGDVFHINVMGKGLGTIFGVALRVEWAPTAFELVDSTVREVLGTETSGIALYRDGEIRPGSLAIALSHLTNLAETELDDDVILATLALRSVNGEPSSLSFFAPRCLVLTRRLDRVETSYINATLTP